MAIHAIGHIPSLGMVEAYLRPRRRNMAGFAELACAHMSLRLASGLNTIVAFGATIDDAVVIEHANIPGGGCVTGAAIIV